MRPGSDPDVLASRLRDAVIQARRIGARVLIGTGMDPLHLPIVRRTRAKVALFNAHVWSIAKDQGAAVLDLWGMRVLQHPQMWARDKIHLSPIGHHRVSQAALASLGLLPDDPDWRTPLPPLSATRMQVWRDQGTWLATDVAPWLVRRIQRRSSGDGRQPKYPTPQPMPSEDS